MITSENIFEPTYQVIPGKMKVINELRKAAQTADAVYLAGDPDREGEAICAHLAHVLSKPFRPPVEVETNGKNSKKKKLAPEDGNGNAKVTSKEVAKLVVKPPKAEPAATSASKIFRVMFNEITPKAIRAAFDHPSQVNENLVDAQQARRVLDRLVGYKVSPLLWDKVRRGLSAGRVQTVALRLIVEREQEIRAFIPKNIGRCTPFSPPANRQPSKPSSSSTTAKTSKFRTKPKRNAFSPQSKNRHLASRQRRPKRKAPLRAAAVHHFEAPAGRLQPPALHRQAHHDARAAPL